MACQHVTLPDGGRAIVCGTRPPAARCACGAPAPLLCDWKTPGERNGTCDRPICASCSTSPAPDKDLCPQYTKAWAEWKALR